MRNRTQTPFLLMEHLEYIDADLLCTVSAINLRMDELIEREKGKHAYCIFCAKHAAIYRCRFMTPLGNFVRTSCQHALL